MRIKCRDSLQKYEWSWGDQKVILRHPEIATSSSCYSLGLKKQGEATVSWSLVRAGALRKAAAHKGYSHKGTSYH